MSGAVAIRMNEFKTDCYTDFRPLNEFIDFFLY